MIRRFFAPALLAAMLVLPAAARAGDDPRCAEYGEGFVYSEGTATCLRISGEVRAGFVAGGGRSGPRSEGRVNLDVRKQTEYGPLRLFVSPKLEK